MSSVLVVTYRSLTVITDRCPHCHKIFRQGRFAIVAFMDGEKQLITEQMPRRCCGQNIYVPLYFLYKHDATVARTFIHEIIEAEGITEVGFRTFPIGLRSLISRGTNL